MEKQITLFAIIVEKKGTLNSAAMRLLDIQNGGIFEKKPRKNLTGRATISIQGEQSQPTANVAQPGNFGKVDVFSVTSKENTWIIDTRASDHMTRDSNKLQIIHPSSQQVISTTNGNTCYITGEGSVKLSSTLTLETVLVVPSLQNNLLSRY